MSNNTIGIPDPDGNIIEINNENNNKFIYEEHKIDLTLHKEFVKSYIYNNYANLTKKEIFNKENNYIYLKMFCRQYFLNNPDKARDDALTELSKRFETNYTDEINLLSDMLYLGKQYIYDNPEKVKNYIFKLEDIEDNEHNKICKAFPYISKNNKTKNIWLIITNNMKKNIANYKINDNSDKNAISQYFCDITFKCVPKSKFNYKLFILLGYDILLNKSALCCFALIMDMQAETFAFLFNKLKLLYDFNPRILTCDFDFSLRKGLKRIYPDIKFYGCYYHFIRSIRKNLLKYYIKKDNDFKEFYDCFANFRIIPFIINNQNKIEDFLKLIRNKYKENTDNWHNLKDFFIYFETTWIKKININDWNLYLLAKAGVEQNKLDKIFFTNNIVESANSRLNINIKKNKNNTVNNFSKEINKLINLYFTSKNYIPPVFSKTKAIVKYIFETNFNEKTNLINNEDLKYIYIDYKNNIDKNNTDYVILTYYNIFLFLDRGDFTLKKI